MEVLKRWDKWTQEAALTDPSHFYGDRNSVAFIYDSGTLLHASKYKSKTGVFKNGKFIDSIDDDPGKVIHSEIAEICPEEAGKISKSWYRVTHGRVGTSKKEANVAMPLSSSKGKEVSIEVRQVVKVLKRFGLLNKVGPYKIGVFKETEWLFYKVEDEDLKSLKPQDLSTHKIMRDRIYNRAGLEEGIKSLFSLLNEEL